MNIGTRIRDARKCAKLTQRELAEKAGVAIGTIQQYELGKRQPRLEQLQSISRVLNTPWMLLAGDESFEITVGRSEAKKINAEVETIEAVLTLISRLYGDIEDKEVCGDFCSTNYYLVGTGKKSFVLYDRDIEMLKKAILNMISPIIDRIKDTRSENVICSSLMAKLNSDDSRAAQQEALEAHKKRFPDHGDDWARLESLLSAPGQDNCVPEFEKKEPIRADSPAKK